MANPIDATQKASQEIQAMILKATRKAYFAGLRAGTTRLAWWSKGVQYVGTCETPLKDALRKIDKEEERESE